MNLDKLVTVVVINYQTPDLTERAIKSLQHFYPTLPVLLIDNGSKDNSSEILKDIFVQEKKLTVFCNQQNIHHGPAMHQAVELISSEYILFFDSDSHLINDGIVEEMISNLQSNERNYAIGKLIYMNKRGFDIKPSSNGIRYIRPICMMIKKSIYSDLIPFQYHGSPCLKNMQDAVLKNYELLNFEIENYVIHEGQGTASRHGYKLGIRGKINYLLNKLGL